MMWKLITNHKSRVTLDLPQQQLLQYVIAEFYVGIRLVACITTGWL